ncbi:MAG: DUF2341 domain-containing protein [bacterium]
MNRFYNRIALLFLFSLLFISVQLIAQPVWFDGGWSYSRAITLQNTSGDELTDFQVLVTLDASFDFSKANANGSDIRFAADDGTTLLFYWIEEWNPVATSAKVWVKVPSIPAAGGLIFMYYGNPSASFPPPPPPALSVLPPTGPWTNVPGLTIAGLNSSLLAENMVEDAGTYWQLFTNRNACNGQLGFAFNNSGDPANPIGWTWWGDVTIDFSVRTTTAMFTGDPRMDTTPGNLLNPYLDCPHVVKGDDGFWYLFYHWIVGGNAHSGCGVHGSWSWTSDAYAAIGMAKASSITGPYTEIDPNILMSSEMEGDSHAWDWARVSEPYVFKRHDGKWIMLFMGDKGNYDNPGDQGLFYIEQCSYAIADDIAGPYTKWHGGADPFIAFGPSGSLDAGTIADAHPVFFGGKYYVFYAASPTTWGWNTMYCTTEDWESITKSTSYVYTNEGNSPFRGAISMFNDTYYFSYLGSSASSGGPFMICTQPAVQEVFGYALNDPNGVFDFYDGFDGSSLDMNKWNGVSAGYSGTATVAGGLLSICNSGGFLTQFTAKPAFGLKHILEQNTRHSSYGFAGELGWGRNEPTSSWGGPPFGFVNLRYMDLRVINGSNFVIDTDNGDHVESPGDYISTADPLNYDFNVHRITRVDANTARFQLNNNAPMDIINSVERPSRIPTMDLSPWYFILGGSCMDVDWIRVRKFCEPQPVAFVGDEVLHCVADLWIEKTVDNDHPENGDIITFTIKLHNDGPGNSAFTDVTDVIPGGLIFISASTDNGTYDETTGVWTVGFVTVGTYATLTITTQIDVLTSSIDFGPASDFNVFVLEDLNQPSSDTQGKMAVGRDASLANYSVGDQLPPSGGTEDVLVVGRDLTFTSGIVFSGNVVYGNITNLPQLSVSIIDGTLRQDTPIDFAAAELYLKNLSANLAAYPANGSTSFDWGGLVLSGTDPFLNVFDVSGAQLSVANSVQIFAPNGSVVLVNIDSTNVSWMGGLTVAGTSIENVIYNFPEATSLSIHGIDVRGSILAPWADVNFAAGVQNGQMICKSLCGQGQFNLATFIGNIPVAAEIINVAEITRDDQIDPDSEPGNGVPTEDDYSAVTVYVNQGYNGGDDDNEWELVGEFDMHEIIWVLTYDSYGNMLAGTIGGKVKRSNDGGVNWELLNAGMTVGVVWSIEVSGDQLFIGTDQGVFYSADNGATWSATPLLGMDVRTVLFANGNLYAGAWGSGIFKSADLGATWNQVNNGLGSLIINSLASNSANELFAGSFGDGISQSVDEALNWLTLPVGYPHVWALGVTSTDVLYAATYGMGVFRSTDNGTSWIPINEGLVPGYVYSVAVDASDNVFVLTWTGGVYMLSSTSPKAEWIPVGMSGRGVSAIMINDKTDEIFIGTSDGKVYKRSNNITGITNGTLMPKQFELSQNYPNPFNPSTMIEYGIPKEGNYSLKIYNILGQEVITLFNGELKPGYYKSTFNASSFASGVYMYQLTGDNVVLTKKMILMK